MSQNILIRSPNHLGDCVMALPMISEVREAHPGADVTLLTPRPLAEIFENNPSIDRILPIPPEHVHGLVAVMKIKDMISDGNYDIGYILPPSFGAAAGFKLAGIPTRIGYIADGRRLLLTKPLALPEPLNSEHRAEVYFNMLRRGSGLDLTFVRPKMFITESETARALDILGNHGVAGGEDYIVLAVQAVAESRRWGLENYADLANYITAELNTKAIIIGAESDRQAGDTVAELSFENVINLAGKTTLRESAAILSQALLFVGNDSGPAHVAAAVGCPVVVLSGADDPKETSPMSTRKRLLYLDELECISCVKNRCPLTGEEHMACMKGISVQMVIDAVTSLMAESQAS